MYSSLALSAFTVFCTVSTVISRTCYLFQQKFCALWTLAPHSAYKWNHTIFFLFDWVISLIFKMYLCYVWIFLLFRLNDVLCLHPFVHQWLLRLFPHLSAFVNNAAMNTGGQVSVWALVLVLLGVYPKVELLDHIVIFWGISLFSAVAMSVLHSHQQHTRVPVSPHHC